MEYAILQSGGKQYKVSPGDILEIDKLQDPKDAVVVLDKILCLVTEEGLKIGNPFISGASVKATVLDQKRGEKIDVAKFKAKARSRRHIGFRAEKTILKIELITHESVKNTSVKPSVRTKKAS